ncbi:DUF1995 family protein [Leptolyngbya sp. FACHB-261]|uniref:DUF1995 family protein n=1 Tax=Leptolyngbya sp. FACHB-261 TaxID=2692806 RepID=UPI001683E3C5|nr:DUF1995 family protein [Leptolyngbya sp. FACHB-261]MBD2101227.1 DUF1995 family protein [Leptolyngbya sp. FACHB-261]
MTALPNSLDEAVDHAVEATRAALAAGYSRLQIELRFPELNSMPLARNFTRAFSDLTREDGSPGLKVLFADAGAAALARRDWEGEGFEMRGINEGRTKIEPEDRAVLVVAPTSVELNTAEKHAVEAGERPFVLFNPQLEDIGRIGIGYAGRQVRERFLNTFEPCYFVQPLDEDVALLRCYPAPWQVWQRQGEEFQLVAEQPLKPNTDDLNRIFQAETGGRRSEGLLASMSRFLRALSQ